MEHNGELKRLVFAGTADEVREFAKDLDETVKPLCNRLHIRDKVSADKVGNMVDIRPFILSIDSNHIASKEEIDALEILVRFDSRSNPVYYVFKDSEQIKEIQVDLLVRGASEWA